MSKLDKAKEVIKKHIKSAECGIFIMNRAQKITELGMKIGIVF